MAKYRIVKNIFPDGSVSFEAQKRIPILGFWYNFNNIDAYCTGEYRTEEEAMQAIIDDLTPTKHVIIDVAD